MEASSERALIVSSDGHAMPLIRAYRLYLPSRMQERFDEFCDYYEKYGAPPMDPVHLRNRLDPDVLEQWVNDVVEAGRLEGCADPVKRLAEMEHEGVVAEVLFPDFGLPFQAIPPTPTRRYEDIPVWPPRTPEEIEEGNRAHNRWLVDYCSVAPERFRGMAIVSFDDIDAAMAEISWARDAGLKGVLLPTFTPEYPIFHARYDPIWSLLEDLEMPANSHVALSATAPMVRYSGVPHPAVALPLHTGEMMLRCHEVLAHLIWGGVLERHPKLNVAFTEQGSAWVLADLEAWDFSYEGSYMRRDVREVVRQRPSEYFRRQCWLGSSLFSRAEIEARHRIGLDQMLLGMDYPHHEGTFAA
jgi:predicted TIM-barrel fold metal-dependent hydrolase